MALLEVENLTAVFHTEKGSNTAVDSVSLTLEAGEILGIVGESGSGKSVTAFSIMRLLREPGEITAGSVVYNGIDLLSLSNRQMRKYRGREISMIFQEPLSSLNPIQSIGQQVMESLFIHFRLSKVEAKERAIAMLKRVGIQDAEQRFDVYPHQLSGGLRQRVMIALALVCEPKILIADEPTTALDVTIQAQILELLRELQAEFGMAIILITHDLGVIAEVAQRVCVMYAGEVVEIAPVDAIFDRTAHPYSAALINSIPNREIEVERLSAVAGSIPGPEEKRQGCLFATRCSFALPACSTMRQKIVSVAGGHKVACMRAEAGELPADMVLSLAERKRD
jgi:peptide/nickel transport system ATP-binding protein